MAEGAGSDHGLVLLCEDEPIVALDLKLMIEEAGFRVAGPHARITAALADLDTALVAAVLDVRLKDGDVFPVADALTARSVPLIFHSAHVIEDDIAARFPGARYCPKPVDRNVIGTALMGCAVS